jgi:hypothetical protein
MLRDSRTRCSHWTPQTGNGVRWGQPVLLSREFRAELGKFNQLDNAVSLWTAMLWIRTPEDVGGDQTSEGFGPLRGGSILLVFCCGHCHGQDSHRQTQEELHGLRTRSSRRISTAPRDAWAPVRTRTVTRTGVLACWRTASGVSGSFRRYEW